MHFLNILGSLLGAASLTKYVAADLRIRADHFSFGGVNYPGLQFLERAERDQVIKNIVKSGARVIRLFIQANDKFPDPEVEIGSFDRSMLDQLDGTLAAIYHLSEGKVKVIIAPHDSHALRSTNEVPCDAYCKKLDGAFLDFYSSEEFREIYKTRLQVFFKEYPSLNFEGRSWSTLNEVILGVDLQNEPWSGIWPIVAGEPWLCDIATHLKDTLKLGENNIAVLTGGLSGAQSPDGTQNYPDSAFDCPAVDVISFHGYYGMDQGKTAGTNWANMFLPGNTLTARAEGKNKLLMVEEMAYVHGKLGLAYKKTAIWDQGNALNYRGIPWLYSHLSTKGEETSARVNILRDDLTPRGPYAIGALKDVLDRAAVSRSKMDWSPYLPAPPAGLTNLTELALNPYIPEQSDCVFGCEGHLCDAADGCRPDLLCKNSVCAKPAESQPGNIGSDCNSKSVCQEHLQCEDGVCQECLARPSIQPADIRKTAVPNDPNKQCHLDTDIISLFNMRPWCKKVHKLGDERRRGNPCRNAAHCDGNEFCDWGLCKFCTEGCLGMQCRNNNKCKTGYCNKFGRCDYPSKSPKVSGPGARAGGRKGRHGYNAVPRGQQGGPNKVRSEAMRINIPKETVKATGGPVPVPTS